MFENKGFGEPQGENVHIDLADTHPQQRVDSRRLLAGGRELLIDHAGQQYRLRLTRNDKLILTK